MSIGLFIGIGLTIGLAVGIGIGFGVSGTSESKSDSKVSDMQSFQEMMLDDSSTMQEMFMSTMQDSDQMQMMEDMMKDMMNRMQDDPELKQSMMEHMDRMKASKKAMMVTDDSMITGTMTQEMNKVSHFEIPYEDQQRAQKFYQDVFGWQINQFSDEGYFLALTTESDPNTMMPSEPGAINGGLLKRDSTAKNPLLVIDVPNIDEHIKKIEDAGGELIMPKVRVGDSGFFARITDTEGNVIAIWQQLKP